MKVGKLVCDETHIPKPSSKAQAKKKGGFQVWRKKVRDVRQATAGPSLCLELSQDLTISYLAAAMGL